MGYGNYSLSLKKSMVSRFLSDPEQRIGQFSRDNGIPESSLREWIRKAEMGILENMENVKHFKNWKLSEKFNALLEYGKLSEEEKGKWLRLQGIKLERLNLWKEELSASLDSLDDKAKKRVENDKIKTLEKELNRKDKALAEASALLFAKKKLEAIFGKEGEEK